MKREITVKDFEKRIVSAPIMGKSRRLAIREVRKEGGGYTLYLTNNKIYFITKWEVYLKLFGHREGEGILLDYAKKHKGKFKGAKISIKRVREQPTFLKSTKDKDIGKPYFEIKLLKSVRRKKVK